MDLVWEFGICCHPACVSVISWSRLSQVGLDHLDLFAYGIGLGHEDATTTSWGCEALSKTDSDLHLE